MKNLVFIPVFTTPLRTWEVEGLIGTIKRLFAAIPWRNFTKNKLSESEGHYASVLYAIFASLNATIIHKDISHHGQVDMTINLEGYIYVMEIKMEMKLIPLKMVPKTWH